MKNTEIFDGKDLSGLLRDIYTNSKERNLEIRQHIKDIAKYITTVEDATVLAPIVSQYIEQGIKNDDQLVKIAAIVQRLVASEIQAAGTESSALLTEDEKLKIISDMNKEIAGLETEDKHISNTLNILDSDTKKP